MRPPSEDGAETSEPNSKEGYMSAIKTSPMPARPDRGIAESRRKSSGPTYCGCRAKGSCRQDVGERDDG